MVRPDRRDWHAFLPATALLDQIARSKQ
jgi:hypothetical protein